MCVTKYHSYHSIYPHYGLAGTLIIGYPLLVIYIFSHCFPEEKYDTLEYSWVKCYNGNSVRLQN